MTKYVLSPRAKADISEIWDYTVERWGIRQAEIYAIQLKSAIETLASHPYEGQTCDEIRTGYRKYPSGSHILFYRLTSAGIDVVRILHQRMDFEHYTE
jgi:toxin ParE1/3/4